VCPGATALLGVPALSGVTSDGPGGGTRKGQPAQRRKRIPTSGTAQRGRRARGARGVWVSMCGSLGDLGEPASGTDTRRSRRDPSALASRPLAGPGLQPPSGRVVYPTFRLTAKGALWEESKGVLGRPRTVIEEPLHLSTTSGMRSRKEDRTAEARRSPGCRPNPVDRSPTARWPAPPRCDSRRGV
jgi:hypothetical protein